MTSRVKNPHLFWEHLEYLFCPRHLLWKPAKVFVSTTKKNSRCVTAASPPLTSRIRQTAHWQWKFTLIWPGCFFVPHYLWLSPLSTAAATEAHAGESGTFPVLSFTLCHPSAQAVGFRCVSCAGWLVESPRSPPCRDTHITSLPYVTSLLPKQHSPPVLLPLQLFLMLFKEINHFCPRRRASPSIVLTFWQMKKNVGLFFFLMTEIILTLFDAVHSPFLYGAKLKGSCKKKYRYFSEVVCVHFFYAWCILNS